MAVVSTRIELCGRLADACSPFVDLPLPCDGLPVPEMISVLGEHFPALQGGLPKGRIRACINETIVSDDVVVRPGDIVALFPPVSGG
ncbi:MAG: MoaD/ThiS family protein [Sphingopyxis sp.]|nr:MoaD/ThiS family protein [Sphingopyxis sp.]